jgi:hypothetical protein
MTTTFATAFNNLISKIEGNFTWVKTQITSLTSSISGKASSSDLTTHTGNTTVHITSSERTTWNAKADESDLTAHTEDTDIHITSSERTTWNNKQNALSTTNKLSADYIQDGTTNKTVTATEKNTWNGKASASDLTTHTGNTTVHITSSERTAWNGKQDALTSTQLSNIADIPNKADISDIPTKVSDLTNDSHFATESYVDSKVTASVRHQGSVAFANLPSLVEANLNKCYNVTDAFTTTSDFLEGAGHSYPAGTNVMIVESGNSYKYDAKAGYYDLSIYYEIDDLDSDLSTMFTTGNSNITDLSA